MPTAQTSIWLALRARLEELTLSPALAIAWPNEDFTPPQSGSTPLNYLRVTHFPNETQMSTIGSSGYNRHYGILQIVLLTKKNQNIAVAKETAGTIAEWFKVGTLMTFSGVKVRVERPPYVASVLENDTMSEVPLSIRYFADIQRSI